MRAVGEIGETIAVSDSVAVAAEKAAGGFADEAIVF
jgi:hypothetical protein